MSEHRITILKCIFLIFNKEEGETPGLQYMLKI